ncbi:MAG: hypothetical protein WBQ72_03975 [Terriglobales bacterium]|jgi:hypothetical protein
MAVESYPDRLEPEDQNAVIWRFMSMGKFRNLIEPVELYFCRADLFDNDKREGLPLEEYLPALRLNPLDVFDRQKLEHHIGSVRIARAFILAVGICFAKKHARCGKNTAKTEWASVLGTRC